jgi:hypothetical protein
MSHPQGKNSPLSLKFIKLLTLFILVSCVLVAGCTFPSIKNTNTRNSSTPAPTPTFVTPTPVLVQTTVPVFTENATEVKKGLLSVTIGNYTSELPVFIDNKSAGVVSFGNPLNLTAKVGRHTVSICIPGLCNYRGVMVLSSSPTTVDFGDWLTNEIVTGPLMVSIGGYNAELPVLLDNMSVGNVSQGKPLNLMASQGNHTVKVCVGTICENETVEIIFAKQITVDFGERLKKDAEFTTPIVRIVNTRQAGSRVTIDLEYINPTKKDITFITMVQCTYSYIDSQGRKGNFKQITVTRSAKSGTRSNQSSDIYLDGGRAYIIEAPQILNTTYT